MLRNVNEAEYHMIPGINATDCPSAGQCDLCPLSDKCVKLHELRTYEGLLPAMYNCGTRKTKTEKASGWGDEGLYPAGVE